MKLEHLGQFDLVYLATPYTKYPAGIEAAFRDACALAGKLLRAGVNVYSPIAHTHPIAVHSGIDPLDHKIWLPFDAAIMAKADAICVGLLDGWDVSYGVQHEIQVFKTAGKPRAYLNPTTMQLTLN